MNKKFKLYLLASCALHGALIIVMYLISGSSCISTNFLVLGAHSKERLETFYKPMKAIIPFVRHQSSVQPQSQPTPKPEAQVAVSKEKAPERKKTTLDQEKKKPLVPNKKVVPKDLQTPKKNVEPIASQPQPIQMPLSQVEESIHQCNKQIQQEISRLWRPPVGVPKGTECTVRFTINKKGSVDHFEFLKRSKILIYDLSITRVAHKFAFDRSLWGKTFTIDFRQ